MHRAASATLVHVQALLNGALTEISVPVDATNYNAIFQPGNKKDIEGDYKAIRGHTYTSPWESGSIGDPNFVVNPYSESQYKEVAAHELGHAVDIANGLPTRNNFDYAKYDQGCQHLNNATVNGVGVTRDPCNPTAGSNDTAPFAGVLDLRDGKVGGAYPYVCTGAGGIGGSLNANILLALGANHNNEAVLAYIESLWINLQEINAQMFAYKAVGNQGAGGL